MLPSICVRSRRGAAQRVALKGFAPREHQHDDRAGEVLAEQHGRDDRDTAEQVGPELAAEEFEEQLQDEGHPTDDQCDEQWQLVRLGARMQDEPK